MNYLNFTQLTVWHDGVNMVYRPHGQQPINTIMPLLWFITESHHEHQIRTSQRYHRNWCLNASCLFKRATHIAYRALDCGRFASGQCVDSIAGGNRGWANCGPCGGIACEHQQWCCALVWARACICFAWNAGLGHRQSFDNSRIGTIANLVCTRLRGFGRAWVLPALWV